MIESRGNSRLLLHNNMGRKLRCCQRKRTGKTRENPTKMKFCVLALSITSEKSESFELIEIEGKMRKLRHNVSARMSSGT
jgi:hypothetical protein